MEDRKFPLSNKLDFNTTKHQYLSSSFNLLDRMMFSKKTTVNEFNKSKYKSNQIVTKYESNRDNKENNMIFSNKFHKITKFEDKNERYDEEDKLFIPNKNVKLSPLNKDLKSKNVLNSMKENNLNLNQMRTTYNCLFIKDNSNGISDKKIKVKNTEKISKDDYSICIVKKNEYVEKIMDQIINEHYKNPNGLIEEIFYKLDHSIHSAMLILTIIVRNFKYNNKLEIENKKSFSTKSKYTLILEKDKGFCYFKNSEVASLMANNDSIQNQNVKSDNIEVEKVLDNLGIYLRDTFNLKNAILELPNLCLSKFDNSFSTSQFLNEKSNNFSTVFNSINSIFNFGFIFGKIRKQNTLRDFWKKILKVYFNKKDQIKVNSTNKCQNHQTIKEKEIELNDKNDKKIIDTKYKESLKVFDNLDELLNKSNTKLNKHNKDNNENKRLKEMKKQKLLKLFGEYSQRNQFKLIKCIDLKLAFKEICYFYKSVLILQKKIRSFVKKKIEFKIKSKSKIILIQSKIRQM